MVVMRPLSCNDRCYGSCRSSDWQRQVPAIRYKPCRKPPFLHRCSSRTRLLTIPLLCNDWYDGPNSAEFWLVALVVPQLQFIDIFVDFPSVALRQIPMVLVLHKWWSMSLLCSRFHRCAWSRQCRRCAVFVQFLDKVVDVPVVVQRQVRGPTIRSDS